jgi:antitoxin (DNA-binding transcriptional repressor) of toxin-antitoxin stability system
MDTRKTVSLYEAKTQLSALVEEAAGGVEITITKHGKPLAKLSATTAPGSQLRPATRQLGGFADNSPPLTKNEWMRYWEESDVYVDGLFRKASLSQAVKGPKNRAKTPSLRTKRRAKA